MGNNHGVSEKEKKKKTSLAGEFVAFFSRLVLHSSLSSFFF
jgi:hypothetical protein